MRRVKDSSLFYDKISWMYNPTLNWIFNPGRKLVAKIINQNLNKSILEIGSGTGSLLHHCGPLKNYIGIEPSKKMIQIAKKSWPDRNWINKKFEDFHPQEKFDCVILNYTLSVVDSPSQLLEYTGNVLNPNGRVYIINHFSKHNMWIKHVQKLSIHFGYNAYFPFEEKLFRPKFKILKFESVNLLGGWKFIELSLNQNEQN